MEIIVLGAGAIGSLYGAKLAAHNRVTLIGNPAHVRAINERGLRLEGIEQQTVSITARERIDKLAPDSLILLTTKVNQTRGALASIAELVRDDTAIVCLQNGIGIEEIARDTIRGRGVILRGIAQAGAIFAEPGVIQYMARGGTILEGHSRSGDIAATFNRAGLETRISPNITADVWHKLIVNCVVNPITAVLGSEVGAIADERLDVLKKLVIAECLRVATAEGINFEVDFVVYITEVFAPSHNIASMRQDLLRGRQTEIDYLNGAVVRLGAKHRIDCPVNRALAAIISEMEQESASLFPQKMLQSQPAQP